jgi:hypothetical protein
LTVAESQGKRSPGRPKKEKDADHTLLIRLPVGHYDYLAYLVHTKRRLGANPTAAATHILIRELDKMQRTGYHEKDFPKE